MPATGARIIAEETLARSSSFCTRVHLPGGMRTGCRQRRSGKSRRRCGSAAAASPAGSCVALETFDNQCRIQFTAAQQQKHRPALTTACEAKARCPGLASHTQRALHDRHKGSCRDKRRSVIQSQDKRDAKDADFTHELRVSKSMQVAVEK